MKVIDIVYMSKVSKYEKLYCHNSTNIKEIKPNQQSIIKAYITFRSSEAKDLFLGAYDDYHWIYRMFIKCCKRKYRQEYADIELREIEGFWPYPAEPQLPENIQWYNISTPLWEQRARRLVIWIVALIVIVLAFVGILWMKGMTEQTKFIINKNCPVFIP